MNEIMRRALADAMRPLVELVYKLEAKLAGKPHFEWGNVVSVNPLRVKLDSHSTVLPDRPDSIVTGLAVGDRVRVERQGTRVTVHGAGGGASGQPYAMSAGSIIITPTANTPTRATVTFPIGRFSETPVVNATARSAVAGTTVLGVGTTAASSTSVDIAVTRTNTTNTGVLWQAVQMTEQDGEG